VSDQVDRGLVDQEALHRLEVGLAREVGIRALAIARPQPKSDAVRRAEQAFL
jgi:hypothetical protein